MFELGGEWVYSATDLVGALRCEYQVLQRRAERAGVVPKLETAEDALLARAATLGLAHEDRMLGSLVGRHGSGVAGKPGGVVEIEQPSTKSRTGLEAAHAQTLEALQGGADVVFQAAFFDGRFHGLADFISLTERDEPGFYYEPADTKLSRHAKVEALLQLAAYSQQMIAMGLPEPEFVHVWLGDGTDSPHRLADLLPVLVDRSERMEELLALDVVPPVWDDPTLRACGRCDHCAAAIEGRRDVLLVAGLRVEQRRKLAESGITTIEELAAAPSFPKHMKRATFAKLRSQARLQLAQDETRTEADPLGTMSVEVHDEGVLAHLPEPNPGDVFFDFEGDPLHTEDGWPDLGLEYLFGLVTHAPEGQTVYRAIWAHDRREERDALEVFIDWLSERRQQAGFEGLHVYHYAPYEVTALKRLAQRHGTRGAELDVLLREGVFVDLYSTVRRSIRVSERSYSIKKLEPLYMGAQLRDGEVTGGADSITWYAESRVDRANGQIEQADKKLDDLADYNEYDCVSTLRLRDWLRTLTTLEPVVSIAVVEEPKPIPDKQVAAYQRSAELLKLVGDVNRADRSADQQALALLAAGLRYHHQESLPYWWAHFTRLAAPAEDWERDGEMIVLTPSDLVSASEWHIPPKKRNRFRDLEYLVDLPSSFKLRSGTSLHAIYETPLPHGISAAGDAGRGCGKAELTSVEPEGDRHRVVITESLRAKTPDGEAIATYEEHPVAVSAGDSVKSEPLGAAILHLARTEIDDAGTIATQPALDILRRSPPRLHSAGALPVVEDSDYVGAVTAAVLDLDQSYLAVQGPPGTGKTYVGAHVIRRLVDRGWKVGVVGQSHRTVENLLDQVILEAGLGTDRVAKKADRCGDYLGQKLTDAALLAMVVKPDLGCVVGGTAWDFVNEKRVPNGSLDLLVIDEAGQFSLADTLAVSVSTSRLLLLGDPQQLPQVSQASHAEPVDTAALAWLSNGQDTLPTTFGYFLDQSRRMRPEVCAASSRLSYEGRLDSHIVAAGRHLDGVEPGIITRLIDHEGNTTASAEEAAEVVRLVDDLLGRPWTDEDGARPLEQDGILVVSPYNAQVNSIKARLAAAGHPDVLVGTVDKFQGRQAPVVIVSMASSSAAEGGRGADFALSRNRLNVAISRAQHTAYLVHSPQLTDFVPATPRSLVTLGAFLGVSRAGR